jgi:hypothetical protein
MRIARLGIRGLIGAAWAIALTVAVLPLLPANAESKAQPVESEHLKSLFDRHDVRFVLRASSRNATDCIQTQAGRGQ